MQKLHGQTDLVSPTMEIVQYLHIPVLYLLPLFCFLFFKGDGKVEAVKRAF
jgi:hypothetical protein